MKDFQLLNPILDPPHSPKSGHKTLPHLAAKESYGTLSYCMTADYDLPVSSLNLFLPLALFQEQPVLLQLALKGSPQM